MKAYEWFCTLIASLQVVFRFWKVWLLILYLGKAEKEGRNRLFVLWFTFYWNFRTIALRTTFLVIFRFFLHNHFLHFWMLYIKELNPTIKWTCIVQSITYKLLPQASTVQHIVIAWSWRDSIFLYILNSDCYSNYFMHSFLSVNLRLIQNITFYLSQRKFSYYNLFSGTQLLCTSTN